MSSSAGNINTIPASPGPPATGGAGTFDSGAMGTLPATPNPLAAGGNTVSRSLAPGSRLQGGRYIVKKILGQGGMGAALLATDIRLDGKSVVIKELISENSDPAKLQEDVRNFKREVATLAHIDHPLIPSVTDHFQEGTRYFMVQEYVEGENLEERLERTKQPLKERDALIYASQILDVLDYLAQQTPPIIHRDIKPANIIIGAKDKRAHLVDFGIARAEVARNARRKQTSALGTPGYAPPEQYQGNADPRSDLYALGATLHHLLTNRDPRNHAPFAYPPARTLNPQLSQEIEQILMHALVNDITQRYQSAAAMKQDIDAVLMQRFGVAGSVDSYKLGATPAPPTAHQGPTPLPPTVLNPTITSSTPASLNTPPNTPPTVPSFSSGFHPPTPAPPPTPGQLSSPGLPSMTPSSLQAPPPYGYPYPPGTYSPVPPTQRKQRATLRIVVVLLVILLLIGGTVANLVLKLPLPWNSGAGQSQATPIPQNGLGITMIGNEPIGISDGSFAFDTGRPGGALKAQAANALKQNNKDYSSAQALLQQALAQDSNDAEALIYLEDLKVLASGRPYVTVVVATMLSGNETLIGVGRDNLQGAYVAQKEFNDGAKIRGGVLVRVLVASSGSKKEYATNLVRQIVQLAKSDKTFVGVMGWPYSSRAILAVQALSKEQVRFPMVSPTASDDGLTGISPYFFRVAPPNKAQAIAGAKYAETVLHAKTVAVFFDPADPYSQSLKQGFVTQFKNDGNSVVAEETYTVGKPETLPASLQKALNANPDFIYFSGYADDLSKLLINLPPGNLPIMGGDALYELSGYPSSARSGFSRLHFTTFAYPDEWEVLGYGDRKPAFFSAYAAAFDPNRQHQGSPYGYTRPANDTILSYDAMSVLLKACDIAFSTGKQAITPEDVKQALGKINGDNALQGVSGQISFGTNGDPTDKAIVILYVDPEGHIKMESTRLGRFLK
ncbi:MAG: protein kinase [Ktedonobacteraceae bacterium]|nr:protein kinase [Ktedonobacteraceae bacterium]